MSNDFQAVDRAVCRTVGINREISTGNSEQGQMKIESMRLSLVYEGRRISPPAFEKTRHGTMAFLAAVFDPDGWQTRLLPRWQAVERTFDRAPAPPETFVKLGPTMICCLGTAGCSFQRDRRLEGRMDELMIFRSALSPEEIHKIYEGTKE